MTLKHNRIRERQQEPEGKINFYLIYTTFIKLYFIYLFKFRSPSRDQENQFFKVKFQFI